MAYLRDGRGGAEVRTQPRALALVFFLFIPLVAYLRYGRGGAEVRILCVDFSSLFLW